MQIAFISYTDTQLKISGTKTHPNYLYTDVSCLIKVKSLKTNSYISETVTDKNGYFEFVFNRISFVTGIYQIEYYGSGVVEGKDWETIYINGLDPVSAVLTSSNGNQFKYQDGIYDPSYTILQTQLTNIDNPTFLWKRNGVELKTTTRINGEVFTYESGATIPLPKVPDNENTLGTLTLDIANDVFYDNDFATYTVDIEGTNQGVPIEKITLKIILIKY